MGVQRIDLTSGHVKVLGNRGDTHTFVLSNSGEELIATGNEYEAELTIPSGKSTVSSLDTSSIGDGVLSFPLTIVSGTYRIRRVSPRRTLLTIEVEAQ